jgi:hypothetical protein
MSDETTEGSLEFVTDGVDEGSDVGLLNILVCGDAVGSNEDKVGMPDETTEGSLDFGTDGVDEGSDVFSVLLNILVCGDAVG